MSDDEAFPIFSDIPKCPNCDCENPLRIYEKIKAVYECGKCGEQWGFGLRSLNEEQIKKLKIRN